MSAQVVIHHQVAIAGQVTDAATAATIEGALIQISSAPAAFTDWLALRSLQMEQVGIPCPRGQIVLTQTRRNFFILSIYQTVLMS